MNCPKCGKPMAKNGHEKDGTQKWRCRPCKYYPSKDEVAETTEQPLGLTETQLRARYDIRFIVATKCKELKPGVYLTKSEFINFCGIRPGQGYTDVIGHPDYDAFRGKVAGQVYYSHPDSIKKLKNEGVLT